MFKNGNAHIHPYIAFAIVLPVWKSIIEPEAISRVSAYFLRPSKGIFWDFKLNKAITAPSPATLSIHPFFFRRYRERFIKLWPIDMLTGSEVLTEVTPKMAVFWVVIKFLNSK